MLRFFVRQCDEILRKTIPGKWMFLEKSTKKKSALFKRCSVRRAATDTPVAHGQRLLNLALSGAPRQLRVAAPSIRIVPWAALASCWPLPQQLLPVSAAGGGRRRCPQRGSQLRLTGSGCCRRVSTSSVCCADSFSSRRSLCGSRLAAAKSRICVASPFGRGVTAGDGEGEDADRKPLHSDRQISWSERCYRSACGSDFAGLTLSVICALLDASSPKGGAIGRPGKPYCSLGSNFAQSAGPCCLDSQLLSTKPCLSCCCQ